MLATPLTPPFQKNENAPVVDTDSDSIDQDYPPMEFKNLDLEIVNMPFRGNKKTLDDKNGDDDDDAGKAAYEDEDYQVDFDMDLDNHVAKYSAAGFLALVVAVAIVATRRRR